MPIHDRTSLRAFNGVETAALTFRTKECSTKVPLSKLDWFPSTIEAFWGKKMGAYVFSMRFGILREST